MIAYCWGCMRSVDESEMRRRCHAIRLQQRHLEERYIYHDDVIYRQ